MAGYKTALSVLMAGRKGTEYKSRRRNLTEVEIKEIVRMYHDGNSCRALGALFKVSHTTVYRLAKGELAPEITRPWLEELAKRSTASLAGDDDEPEPI